MTSHIVAWERSIKVAIQAEALSVEMAFTQASNSIAASSSTWEEAIKIIATNRSLRQRFWMMIDKKNPKMAAYVAKWFDLKATYLGKPREGRYNQDTIREMTWVYFIRQLSLDMKMLCEGAQMRYRYPEMFVFAIEAAILKQFDLFVPEQQLRQSTDVFSSFMEESQPPEPDLSSVFSNVNMHRQSPPQPSLQQRRNGRLQIPLPSITHKRKKRGRRKKRYNSVSSEDSSEGSSDSD